MAEQSPLEAFGPCSPARPGRWRASPSSSSASPTDAPSASRKQLRVPMPGRNLPREQVAEARGFADGFALRERHHDPRLHARIAPADASARAVFDAVEQARVEALGARGMAGRARQSRPHALEMRLRTDPLTRARSRAEVPLGSALGLMVRERLTGEAPPDDRRGPGSPWCATGSRRKPAPISTRSASRSTTRRAFAALATRLLEDLELVEAQPEATEPEERRARKARSRTRATTARKAIEDQPGGQADGQMDVRSESRPRATRKARRANGPRTRCRRRRPG